MPWLIARARENGSASCRPVRELVGAKVSGCFVQNDDRQRVLDGADIVALVGDHVALKPKGREYVGLCPFHDDHKPSMYVVPQKGIYHCFSCGAGGNAIDFVVNYHKLEFLEALKHIADRFGIELTPPAARRGGGERARSGQSRAELMNASRFAHDFFRAVYRHGEHGQAARDAAHRRGLSPETIETFQIGAAPDRWDGLLTTANKSGVPAEALRGVGLLKSRSSGGGAYDAFRNRLIFPILDQLERPIAFGGRTLGEVKEGEPKYLNSPESPLFDKSSTLFALPQAIPAMRRERMAIVTEGYTDAIACHQAGFTTAVATLGVALTRQHAAILRRMCERIVLLFDGDEAGQRAADRAVELLFSETIGVEIAVLPDGMDPDDLLKQENGPERFRQVIDDAVDALSYRFRRLRVRLDAASGEPARTRLIEEDLEALNRLGLREVSLIRRQRIFKELAKLAGVDEATIATQARMLERRGVRRRVEEAPATRAEGELDLSAGRTQALACLVHTPRLAQHLDADGLALLTGDAYPPGPLKTAATVVGQLIHDDRFDEAALWNALETQGDAEARRCVSTLISDVTEKCHGDDDLLRGHLLACLTRIRIDDARRRERSADDTGAEKLETIRMIHATAGGDPLAAPRGVD